MGVDEKYFALKNLFSLKTINISNKLLISLSVVFIRLRLLFLDSLWLASLNKGTCCNYPT